MKAVIFGAGNIGRGLLGDALADSGYTLTYVDADSAVVKMLAERGEFDVVAAGHHKTVEIAGIVDAADEDAVTAAVAAADLIATAVGAPILKIVAPVIGAGLSVNRHAVVNVIACENVHPNSAALREHIADACGEKVVDGIGFPNVVVDRIVPGAPGAADVEVEEGFEFVIDRNDWRGEVPAETPIIFSANLAAYKLRKLWLVNGLHAIAAWLGIRRGHEYIHEAVGDDAIRSAVEAAGAAAAAALAAESDEFSDAQLDGYRTTALERFANSELPDVAVRVARNPLAKLAAGERVLGPANAADALGVDTTGFAAGIVAALTLTEPSVAGLDELREALSGSTWEDFVLSHCGVDRNGRLFTQIGDHMTALEGKGGAEMLTEEIEITNPAGLHARPAAEIVERAKGSEAQIQIQKGDKSANAKSIMSVLALGAKTGDTVTVVAEGDGAQEAIAALREIMQSEEH